MNDIQRAVSAIQNADAFLIGASNGLSISEGLHLFAGNEAFEKLFGDYKAKYGLQNILHGMSARWPGEEEYWAFWSRLIDHYCIRYQPTQVMKDLKALVGNKDTFIVTSNGECHFELCGFDPEKIYEVEGNWLTMQCSQACHNTLYPTTEAAAQMIKAQKNGKIPSELVPHCPKCRAPMQIHMISENYIEDDKAQKAYIDFIQKYKDRRLVILELGIGWRNQLIKAPLMRLCAQIPDATYITINLGEIYIADNIKEKSIGLDGPLNTILAELRKEAGL